MSVNQTIKMSEIHNKSRIAELKKAGQIRDQIVANDYQFLEVFYNYVELDDLESAKEIRFPALRKVLSDLSIKFAFDMEPASELINAKHSNLVGISYPLFKECLIEWLEQQQKTFSQTVDIHKTNIKSKILDISNNNDAENKDDNMKAFEFSDDIDVNMIILHRTLYLIKMKFENNDLEIKDIYKKWATRDKAGLEVDSNNFIAVLEEILKRTGMSITEINRPGDYLKIEVLEKLRQEKTITILKDIEKFMLEHRERYNDIIIEKKGYLRDGEVPDFKILNKQDETELIKPEEKSPKASGLQQINQADVSSNSINENKKSSTPKSINQKVEKESVKGKSDLIKTQKSGSGSKGSSRKSQEKLEKSGATEVKMTSTIKSDKMNIVEESKKEQEKKEEDVKIVDLEPIEALNIQDVVKEKKNIIFIEVLPLILADFIQENSGVVAIDMRGELRKELKALFDNEILQRLGEEVKNNIEEEKINKIKELLFEKMNIENNIHVYEDLLLKKRAIGDNTMFIEGMLQKLKIQKSFIEKEVRKLQEFVETENDYKIEDNRHRKEEKKDVNNSPRGFSKKAIPTKEEKRKLATKEIFHFYSKQHFIQGLSFEEIKNKRDHLDLGEFMKFCIEFRIPCKKEMLIEVFKKTAGNTRNMTYDEFLFALTNLSVKVNDDRMTLLYERIKKLDSIGKEAPKTKADYLSQKRQISMARLQSSKSPQREEKEQMIKTNEAAAVNITVNSQQEKLTVQPNIIAKSDKPKEESVSIKQSQNSKKQKDLKSEKDSKIVEQDTTKRGSIVAQPAASSSIINEQAIINSEVMNPDGRSGSVGKEDQLKKEIDQEKTKIKALITELKQKPFEMLKEELMIFLEIDYENLYRKKMKGFILPFHSDKNYRIPLSERNIKHKIEDPRSAAEIRRIIQSRKEEKLREEIEKERLLKLKYIEERKKLQKLNEQKQKEHERLQVKDSNTYIDIKRKFVNYEREKSYKITWDQLEHLNPNYFVTNKEDDFNPQALLGEIDYDSEEEALSNMVNKRDFTKLDNAAKKKGTLGKSGFSNSVANSSNQISNSKFSPNINTTSINDNSSNTQIATSSITNTSKKAKEQDKAMDDKKMKLLNHNDNLVKKGIEIVQKKLKG